MTSFYHQLFKLPGRLILDKKITKVFFLKNFELSAGEKKTLAKIKNMLWWSSLKPDNANIKQVLNEHYHYEELQIMVCSLDTPQLNSSIVEKHQNLFQKYIPYHIILLIENENEFVLTTSSKRLNLKDAGKRTIEMHYSTPPISKLYKNDLGKALYQAIDYKQLNKNNLETTHQAYIKAIIQYRAANLTGVFQHRTHKRTMEDLNLLHRIEEEEKEVIALKNQIKKEKQLNLKIELNVNLQNKRKQIDQLKDQLRKEES